MLLKHGYSARFTIIGLVFKSFKIVLSKSGNNYYGNFVMAARTIFESQKASFLKIALISQELLETAQLIASKGNILAVSGCICSRKKIALEEDNFENQYSYFFIADEMKLLYREQIDKAKILDGSELQALIKVADLLDTDVDPEEDAILKDLERSEKICTTLGESSPKK